MQIRFKNTFGYTSRDINESITIDDSVIIGAITAVTSEDVEATIYDCPMGAEWVELFKSRLAEVGAIFDNDTSR